MARIKISDLAKTANTLLEGITSPLLSRCYEGAGRSKELPLSQGYGKAELNLYSVCLLIIYQGYMDYKNREVKSFNQKIFAELCKKNSSSLW